MDDEVDEMDAECGPPWANGRLGGSKAGSPGRRAGSGQAAGAGLSDIAHRGDRMPRPCSCSCASAWSAGAKRQGRRLESHTSHSR